LGHNFKKAGDINKASEGLKENFNFMSHDPSHWEYEIKITKNFHLTLWSYARYAIWNEIPGYFKWSLSVCLCTMGWFV
jgi:hypothetical protein